MRFIRSRVLASETLFGTFVNLGSPLTAEIIGEAGYDWALLDLEHGAGGEQTTLAQMQALEHTSAVPLVRIERNDRPRVHRVLDFGAAGVMVPRVETADEAREAVANMRYQPAGVRGVALMNRSAGFGARAREYMAAADSQLLTIVQIESPAAVAAADAIAAVDGVDVLFVGPSDLSQAMGIFGRYDDPRYLDAIAATARAARAHGKAAGILLPTIESLAMYWEAGYRFLGAGSDGGLLRTAATTQLGRIRELMSPIDGSTSTR
jgi:4-hydroxy-2-oxoheptanedioate aldolase